MAICSRTWRRLLANIPSTAFCAPPKNCETAVGTWSTTRSYSVSTNGTNKKITGSIDAAMPANTALNVTLTAPTGGSSAGAIALTTAAQDLVNGITTLAESGLTIGYEFTATAAAGIVPSSSRTVTFTVTDGP